MDSKVIIYQKFKNINFFERYKSVGTDLALTFIDKGFSFINVDIQTFKRLDNSKFGNLFFGNFKILKSIFLVTFIIKKMNINLNEKKRFKQPFLIQDIKIGLKRKFSLKITEKLHNDFKKFSGDTSAIHNDIKFCKNNGFPKK